MDVHPTKNVSIGIDPYPNQINELVTKVSQVIESTAPSKSKAQQICFIATTEFTVPVTSWTEHARALRRSAADGLAQLSVRRWHQSLKSRQGSSRLISTKLRWLYNRFRVPILASRGQHLSPLEINWDTRNQMSLLVPSSH